jgi:hypothetical protein
MSNQYVIDRLRVKLAEIQADARATEQRLRRLAHDKAVILDALRLFDVQDAGRRSSLRIKRGTLARTILDTLREAGEPMSVRQVGERLAERAEAPLSKSDMNKLVAQVRNAMPRLSDALDTETRDRVTYWRVKKDRSGQVLA